jgi:hypothetical protein
MPHIGVQRSKLLLYPLIPLPRPKLILQEIQKKVDSVCLVRRHEVRYKIKQVDRAIKAVKEE